MPEVIRVSDFPSNAPEQIEHYAKLIRNSPLKIRLFEEIYRGKRAVKTTRELAASLGVSEKHILTIGKPLATHHLFEDIKKDSRIAYKKRSEITAVKNQILALARNRAKLEAFPTKR